MGRRSRKRSAPGARAAPPRPAPPAPSLRRRSRLEGAPPAPWGSFPLAELCVLVGIVLFVLGLITRGYRGSVEIACGLALASLAGLEVSIREHFAGHRSHTLLLSSFAGAAVVTIVLLARAPYAAGLAAGVAVFLLAFRALREVFRRRSGGFSFR